MCTATTALSFGHGLAKIRSESLFLCCVMGVAAVVTELRCRLGSVSGRLVCGTGVPQILV